MIPEVYPEFVEAICTGHLDLRNKQVQAYLGWKTGVVISDTRVEVGRLMFEWDGESFNFDFPRGEYNWIAPDCDAIVLKTDDQLICFFDLGPTYEGETITLAFNGEMQCYERKLKKLFGTSTIPGHRTPRPTTFKNWLKGLRRR